MASSSSAPSANIGATPQPEKPAASTQTPEETVSADDQKPATTTAPNAPSAENPAQQQRTNNNDDDDDDDDDESEFDELDEVLDDFKPKPSPAPAKPDAAQPSAPDDFDEEAFLRQLEQDMANMMGGIGGGASNDAAAAAAGATDSNDGTLDKDAEAFAKILEQSGVSPSDFLKQLVGDVMMKGDDDNSTTAATAGSSAAPAAASPTPSTSGGGTATTAAPETFNDTIQRTIERMKESGDKATAAASEDDMSDDLVAQLIKAIEAGASSGEGGDEGDLTKMFMGMMEQLSNKEILYEPIKELDTKFGPWIKENKGKGKVSEEDMARYERQAGVVRQIVSKFEEKGYSDEDPKCREYVWEKMQEMQAAGNPPDELISAPWMEDLKGPGGGAGAGGVPDCPQQ